MVSAAAAAVAAAAAGEQTTDTSAGLRQRDKKDWSVRVKNNIVEAIDECKGVQRSIGSGIGG